MNSNIESIIKKYIRKVILPRYNIDYDEIDVTFPGLNETNIDEILVFIKINPYKVFKNLYALDFDCDSYDGIYLDFKTLDTAFNVFSRFNFIEDEELADKFKEEYLSKLKKRFEEKNIDDIKIDFYWWRAIEKFTFEIEYLKKKYNQKDIIDVYNEIIGKSEFVLYINDKSIYN